MANKLPSLVAFLVLLALQEMVVLQSDAACWSYSRLFRGSCFSSDNCGSVCVGEGFEGGKCKYFSCRCFKPCASQNPTQGQGPPEENQPGEGPPNEEQPGEGPPNEEEPGEGPPEE